MRDLLSYASTPTGCVPFALVVGILLVSFHIHHLAKLRDKTRPEWKRLQLTSDICLSSLQRRFII